MKPLGEKMRYLRICVLIFAGASIAAVALPTSPKAVDAKRKYDAATQAASAEYSKTINTANTQYIADLDAALKTAMAGGPAQLEEVKRIDAESKKATALQSHPKVVDSNWIVGTYWLSTNGVETRFKTAHDVEIGEPRDKRTVKWSIEDDGTIVINDAATKYAVTFTPDHLSFVARGNHSSDFPWCSWINGSIK